MTEFTDPEGQTWIAFVHEEVGADYKGRFYLLMRRSDQPDEEALALKDVRWNTERTARRTLETMSVVELRRRLRTALGRGASATVG